MSLPLMARLNARDRALFSRLLLHPDVPASHRAQISMLTELGGARAAVAFAMWPWFAGPRWSTLAQLATLSLVVSHLLVQMIKRTVGRPRPSRGLAVLVHIAEPDRFSFPSGHATAAMAIAVSYAHSFPTLTVPLLALAATVGATRICLGVHYPGDVAAGQLIALLTFASVRVIIG